MGGTSYDVCLVRGGEPRSAASGTGSTATSSGCRWSTCTRSARAAARSRAWRRARCASGRRAPADPGPICYGRGGTRPTVTDANLVLGYLNPEALCGGEFKLDAGGRARGDPRAGRPAARARRGRGGARHLPDRERQHGQRDPARLLRGGPRPARLPHGRVRRQRPGARAAAGRGARDPQLLVPKTSPAFSALGLLVADYVVDGSAPTSRRRAARRPSA